MLTLLQMPDTQIRHIINRIEYDTVNAAFLFPVMGEQDTAFFMPKYGKEATPCYLLPALTGPLNG